MVAVARETILTAFANLVFSLPGLITTNRRPRYWSDVPIEEQPAMFMAAGDQEIKNDPSGLPTSRILKGDLYLYVQSSDATVAPSIILNGYLDQLEALLASPSPGSPWPGGVQTLGGLVRSAWITGPIATSGDLLGSQGIAIIPFEIHANA